MATVSETFSSFFGLFSGHRSATVDSRIAREFAQRAYKQTGGATKDLKRVYDSYLDNERRRESERRSAD